MANMKHQQFDYLTKLAKEKDITLVAVSKTQPFDKIMELYDKGQRVFGENRVQELIEKEEALPKDIQWHMIGHLQTNKVKYIIPFVSLIHSVDSFKLLDEINKQAQNINRKVAVLLQVYIADEETKYGFSEEELKPFFGEKVFEKYPNVVFKGLMGMATNTENEDKVRREFSSLSTLYKSIKSVDNQYINDFKTVSMGMSNDYAIALEEGSNMIRVGSLIFKD